MSLYASQPWLSELPSRWSRSPLKFVLRRRTIRGRAGAELLSVYRDHGVVPKSSRDDNFNRAGEDLGANLFVEPGDLVVNKMKAWQGSLAVSDHEGIVSPAYFTFSVARSVVGRYLHHLLRSDWFIQEYVRISSGIRPNQWDLDIYAFGRLIIPLPPRDNQRRIAAFLDRKTAAIDALIAKKERMIELLQEKRQALITQAVTKGLDPTVPMRDSGVEWLGQIPRGWSAARLMYLTPPRRSIMYGIVLPGPDFAGGVPVVKSGDCNPDRLIPERLSRTDPEIEAGYVRSRLRPGDIVYAIRGSVGATAIVPPELDGANLTQDAARIAPVDGVLNRWLLYALQARPVWAQVETGILGATVKGINIRDLKRPVLPVPPRDEQGEIAEFLDRATDRLTREVQNAEKSIGLLGEYRQALISAAVTGKIEIPTEEAA